MFKKFCCDGETGVDYPCLKLTGFEEDAYGSLHYDNVDGVYVWDACEHGKNTYKQLAASEGDENVISGILTADDRWQWRFETASGDLIAVCPPEQEDLMTCDVSIKYDGENYTSVATAEVA